MKAPQAQLLDVFRRGAAWIGRNGIECEKDEVRVARLCVRAKLPLAFRENGFDLTPRAADEPIGLQPLQPSVSLVLTPAMTSAIHASASS